MQWFTEQKQRTSENKMQGAIFEPNMAKVGRERKLLRNGELHNDAIHISLLERIFKKYSMG
jgi:hypothetical protein